MAILFVPFLFPQEATQEPVQEQAEQKPEQHTVLKEQLAAQEQEKGAKKNNKYRKKNNPKLINFYFDNEDLIDIINYLASLKEVNVVLPMGANAINAKVTLHLEEKITIDQAWDILYTLLDLAGYSMIVQENMYRIVKTSKDVVREPMPLYIVSPQELPDNDKRIRYIYYFKNIKVSDDQNQANEIWVLLKDVLPDIAFFRTDSLSNSLIVTDKANNIKALMNIVTAFDTAEAQEKPEIIRLRYLSADFVARLFNDEILKSSADMNPLMRPDLRKPTPASYFSKKLKIVPDNRNNSLIVFGRPQAVERVRDFIQKYIDVELESGKSILHTYQLQYLDAKDFSTVLNDIVKSSRGGGTEQSKAGVTAGNTERDFYDVVIKADYPRTITGQQPGGAMLGSNNLVIAARNDDWLRIKKLIEELDTPQQQVIIEVLIADLTLVDQRALGMSFRNPLGLGLASNVNIQSAQFNPIMLDSISKPTTIQSDLLRTAFQTSSTMGPTLSPNCDPTGTTPSGSSCVSIADGRAAGTAMISLNDKSTGQTWGIGQVRKFIDNKRVLSHPHLITTNNGTAEILVRTEKLLVDEGSGSTGGTTTATRKWVPADLKLVITPRISAGGMVNLQVNISIDEFVNANITATDATAGDRATRNVTTNANVLNGSVLALGGLTRVDSATSQNQVPLLARIPIIGWLFKNRDSEVDKNNLTVFISPIIIEPRLRAGVGEYTKQYVQLTKNYVKEGMLFDGLRDPITRWFFKPQAVNAEAPLDEFISQDDTIAPTIFDTRVEQKKYANNDAKQEKSSEKKSDDLKSLVNELNKNPFEKMVS
jgi:general secretion pathway protein D